MKPTKSISIPLLSRNGNGSKPVCLTLFYYTLKKILQYSRHLMRAKGRHGTHSPFVYAFVEQVMRAKARPAGAVQAHVSPVAYRLLYKTIKHLAPEVVYAGVELLPLIEHVAKERGLGIKVMPLPEQGALPPVTSSVMVCVACAARNLPVLKTILLRDKIKVVVTGPHTGKDSLAVWDQLSSIPEVKVSLDYWHLGLLVTDPAFKAKQHFRLR